jgi:hypothetical protein
MFDAIASDFRHDCNKYVTSRKCFKCAFEHTKNKMYSIKSSQSIIELLSNNIHTVKPTLLYFELLLNNINYLDPSIILPMYIIFEYNSQNNMDKLNKIIEQIKNSKLKLLLRGCDKIIELKLYFLSNLNNLYYDNSQCHIKLPFDWLLGENFITKNPLQVHIQVHLFENLHESVNNIFILNRYTFMLPDDKNTLKFLNTPIKSLIQSILDYNDVKITISELGCKKSSVIIENPTHLTRGFFIETNVNNINKIELYLNDVFRFSYDKCMLNIGEPTICNIISDKIFYIPMTLEYDYKIISKKSLDGIIGNLNGSLSKMELCVYFQNDCLLENINIYQLINLFVVNNSKKN